MRTRHLTYRLFLGVIPGLFLILQCGMQTDRSSGRAPVTDIRVPDGFEVAIVADSVGQARHLAVNDNGDIYVKLKSSDASGGALALRDTTGDGVMDVMRKFGNTDDTFAETEMRIHDGFLYLTSSLGVYRYELTPGALVPEGPMDTVVVDDHQHGDHEHNTKPIAFDGRGHIYVPFGAPNNACQEPKRTPEVPGLDPCPYLEDHGGVWRFAVDGKRQLQRDAERYASGLRSVVAMGWHPVDDELYIVMHGRDDLHRLFPNRFSPWQNAVLPAEEFMRVTKGSDFGWPYCYYDQLQQRTVLAPEYGGDGTVVGRCAAYDDPEFGFPGHFAPNDLLFYRGDQFPERYRDGAFVVFHGSTIRTPYPQAGYFVGFVPFREGRVAGEWEVFANGFAGVDPIVTVSDAVHRPSGIAIGPDGSLYVTDDRLGTIWKITFTGDRSSFGPDHLLGMVEEKRTASNIRQPREDLDNLERELAVGGEQLYVRYCASCHQRDGKGTGGRYPPLAETDWVTGDKEKLIRVVVGGLEGPIEVRGQKYNGIMPQHSFLSDEQVAELLTFVRQSFGNSASEVSVNEVRAVRTVLEEDGTGDRPGVIE